MLRFALLVVLISLVRSSGLPWYPYLLPMSSGGQPHRHTTHIVTHPIVHTRVIVLEDDDHRYSQNHGRSHLHQHNHGLHHQHGHIHLHHPKTGHHRQQQAIYGRSNAVVFPKSPQYKTEARHHYPEDYSEYKYGHPKGKKYYSEREIRYSLPVSESPWKPLNHIPNHAPEGYLPLKHLGLDEEKVARIVREAMNEINRDIEEQPKSSFPTGIQDLIGPRLKPLPDLYRGAVFYDQDDVPQGRNAHTGQVANYRIEKDPSQQSALKLNIECQCQAPYSKY